MRWSEVSVALRVVCTVYFGERAASFPTQVWTGVETQDVAVLKLRKSGGAPSRMVVVRSR